MDSPQHIHSLSTGQFLGIRERPHGLAAPPSPGTKNPARRKPRPGAKQRALPAGEPRILPLVQFCQIRQAIYRQLLSIVLASRRETFNISANFLPRIRSSLGIKGAHRLVGVQNTFNHVIHGKNSKKCTAIAAVHHFGFRSSTHLIRGAEKGADLNPRPSQLAANCPSLIEWAPERATSPQRH